MAAWLLTQFVSSRLLDIFERDFLCTTANAMVLSIHLVGSIRQALDCVQLVWIGRVCPEVKAPRKPVNRLPLHLPTNPHIWHIAEKVGPS